MNNFKEMNGVYAEFFESHKPARVTVEVSKLPFGGNNLYFGIYLT